MKFCMRKLRSTKGETLIESLVAILIVVFSGLTLYFAVTTSARINASAAAADEDFRAQVIAAEQQALPPDKGQVQITSSSPGGGFSVAAEVEYTGGAGKLASYKLSGK